MCVLTRLRQGGRANQPYSPTRGRLVGQARKADCASAEAQVEALQGKIAESTQATNARLEAVVSASEQYREVLRRKEEENVKAAEELQRGTRLLLWDAFLLSRHSKSSNGRVVL